MVLFATRLFGCIATIRLTFKVENFTCTELMTARSCSVDGAVFLMFLTAQFIWSGLPWNCLPFRAFIAASASASLLILMKPYPSDIPFSVRIILASIFLFPTNGVPPEYWLKRTSISSSFINIDKLPKNKECDWVPSLAFGIGAFSISKNAR